jgi:hypothetical protein
MYFKGKEWFCRSVPTRDIEGFGGVCRSPCNPNPGLTCDKKWCICFTAVCNEDGRNPIKFCTFPFAQHLALLELAFSFQNLNQYMPRGFSYNMTPNLALNSGYDGWRVCRSHITNLSIHSLAFHLPGYCAGSKSTQICSE